jgi:hypothetical protein
MSNTSAQNRASPVSRQFTQEEIRSQFLSHVRHLVAYWAKLPEKTARERCEGVAFSILSTIDGCSMELPAFVLVPAPHPDDREFSRKRRENWYPDAPRVKLCDIAGALHDRLEQLYAKEGVA